MVETHRGERFSTLSALVVGGGSGIGRATAERLAGEGARVGVADVDLAGASSVARELPGSGHASFALDVLTPGSVGDAIANFASAFGAIDVLVHVAGGDTDHGRFEHTPDDAWQSMFELNLLGPVRVIREALPWLRVSHVGGAITVVSSINALMTLGSEPYSAAKAGLGPLIGNLASQLGPEGIRVNGVAPGTVRTRVWDRQGGPDRLAPLYPLKRVGEPADVAAAIAFLCSRDAAWITGHILPVDGGLSIREVALGVPP